MWEGRHLSKGQLPHQPTASGQELLGAEGGGYVQKQHRSALILILKLVTGGLTSIILIVLSTVNL